MAFDKIDLTTPQPNGKMGEPTKSAWEKVNSNIDKTQEKITPSNPILGGMVINSNTVAEGLPGLEVFAEQANGAHEHANITATTYGWNGGGTFHCRFANGTRDNPSTVLSGQIFGGIGGRPYIGTRFVPSSPVSIHWAAKETFSETGNGSCLRILTTKVGSTYSSRVVNTVFSDDGDLIVGKQDNNPVASFRGRGLVVTRDSEVESSLISGGSGVGFKSGYRTVVFNGTVNSPSPTLASQSSFFGFTGYTGSSFVGAAIVGFNADANWSATSTPTQIFFETCGTGSTTRTRRWTIWADGGHFVPVDNTSDIGNASSRVRQIYSNNGTINTSDERLKCDFSYLDDSEVNAAIEIARIAGLHKWKKSVAEKGASARKHVGVYAQKVVEVLARHDLDPFSYGFICYDQWDASPAVYDEDGNKTMEEIPAGDQYAIRYDQLNLFINAAIVRKLAL